MALGNRPEIFMAFRFKLIIDQIIEGGCTEFSGMDITTQVEEYWEGGVNDYVHKLPKETRFANLVLKKGYADRSALWKWHRDVVSGKIERKTVHIVLVANNGGSQARMWSFKEAYPVKWTGPDFKADGNAVAFQTLELAHHGYEGTGCSE